jgi:hypothetical protein
MNREAGVTGTALALVMGSRFEAGVHWHWRRATGLSLVCTGLCVGLVDARAGEHQDLTDETLVHA